MAVDIERTTASAAITAEPAVTSALRARFGDDVIVESHQRLGDRTCVLPRQRIAEALRFLRDEPSLRLDVLVDLAGLDLSTHPRGVPGFGGSDRFQVVYHLSSRSSRERLRIKVNVPEGDPTVPSVSHLYAAADWAEREAYDMYGIIFTGHGNLKRILCHKDFVGHALRKDYDIKQGQWLLEADSLLEELGDAPPEEGRESGAPPDEEAMTELFHELTPMNIGPAHPATHGTFRILVRLRGEVILKAVPEVGYLHRAFEKSAEKGTWTQVIPYTDRLNYCSALMNNIGYCAAVEKLLGVEVTERCKVVRIVLCELSRIIDHLVANGANLVDLGALTNFWYLFKVRERAYEVIEALTGHRLTNSYGRIGGFAADVHPGFEEQVRGVIADLHPAIDDVLGLLKTNRIFLDRTIGIGAISTERALSYGFTGPCLRATGLAHDLRKAEPYYGYETFDFDVPTGTRGDTFDRIMVRFEEMRQSARIIEQALDRMPKGPINIDDPTIIIPPKQEVYATIEGLMNHFVLVYEGIKPPVGEAYLATEAANGELGFYVVSDGSGRPYRVRVRPPCFYIYSAFPEMIEGGMIADAIGVLGSLNVIAGELDR